MTTTRYPGNPDYHDIPPRCAECGRFCGGFDSQNPAIWERNDNWDLPDTHTCYCLDCAVERVQKEHDLDAEEATEAVLGAVATDGGVEE